MVCLDTSEHMRNGDFVPTRHESQQDAANLVVGAKMQQNAENSVGVLTMASVGRRGGARVLVSPTDDMGKILASLHEASIAGKLNLVEGVQVAQLALKHRRNKNGGQRLVLFVGSPVEAEAKALVKAGKLLKKNNIAVDVVLLGSDEASADKLRQFVEAATSHDNSNFVQIPPGVVPSDVLISSPVVQPDGGQGSTAAAEAPDAGAANFGGVDANLDPELAMALRVSMEEERARQQAAAAAQREAERPTEQSAAADEPPAEPAPEEPAVPEVDDDDALLQQALAMSMREHVASQEAADQEPDEPPPVAEMEVDEDDETMQLALQMSMQTNDAKDEAKPAEDAPTFSDPNFVNQMLAQLPGVDPNDPAIKAALESIRGAGTDDNKPNQDDKPTDDQNS